MCKNRIQELPNLFVVGHVFGNFSLQPRTQFYKFCQIIWLVVMDQNSPTELKKL